jgi:hypothetical protein
MFGYRVQHRLNRRVRDEAQHLRGGSLLLHRLGRTLTRVGDLLPACFELLFEIGASRASSHKARLRSGQTKLATSRSALRACARQGYLHRRTGPQCRSSQPGTGSAGRIARTRKRPGVLSGETALVGPEEIRYWWIPMELQTRGDQIPTSEVLGSSISRECSIPCTRTCGLSSHLQKS